MMFQDTRKSLIIRYSRGGFVCLILFLSCHAALKAQESLPYSPYFNPEKGFKPAQRSLTEVFLQLAGSLEYYGTPEPYIRHIMTEHSRIGAKSMQATGKGGSSRPVYLTDQYVGNLIAGWNKLSTVLALENLTKQSGRNMRYAIMGSWNMSVAEMVSLEDKLLPAESAIYRNLLKKDWFEKRDFPTIESFYAAGYDKLTESGKNQMSKRTWRGTQPQEKRAEAIRIDKGGSIIVTILNCYQTRSVAYMEDNNAPKAGSEELESILVTQLHLTDEIVKTTGLREYERDALCYTHEIRKGFMKRIHQVQSQAKLPGQAESIVKALIAMPKELVVIAQMEFELGLEEAWADRKLIGH